jgi:hypothetical protein
MPTATDPPPPLQRFHDQIALSDVEAGDADAWRRGSLQEIQDDTVHLVISIGRVQ